LIGVLRKWRVCQSRKQKRLWELGKHAVEAHKEGI
jgi:hypothetical protein